MVYAAVLAGGIGSRMQNTDIPKQFLDLDGKPIIIHTVEKMLMNTSVDVVYIGINPNWLTFCEDLVAKHLGPDHGVKIVAGGADRNGTIINILDDIEKSYGINDDDIIVTHDAVRPFLTQRIIDENIDAAAEFGACDTVVKASDTIVRSEDGKCSSIYVGVAPFDINQNVDTNHWEFGWYYDCYKSALCSGQPHNCWNTPYWPRKEDGGYVKTGDIVNVTMNASNGSLSFALRGTDLGCAFSAIPRDRPLVPCVLLHFAGDSVELVL